jgi:hypothetical protein
VSNASDFFEQFQRSAWRLETRPFYGPDADEFQRFQHGQSPTAEQQRQRQRWMDRVAAATSAARMIGRVLVVTGPLTPYLRWRVETGRGHAAVGEDIRIADCAEHPALADLVSDYWIFDDERVLLLEYDPQGAFLRSRQVTDRAVVERCLRERELAIACSLPLRSFSRSPGERLR